MMGVITQKVGIIRQESGILLLKNEITKLKNEIITQMMGIIRQEIGILLLKNDIITLKIQITRQKIEGGIDRQMYREPKTHGRGHSFIVIARSRKGLFRVVSFTGDEAICPFYYGFRFTGCHTQQ